MCFSPQRRAIFRHLNFKKCSETVSFFNILTWKMCFSPQRRAIFRHRNFKKWSENVVFCTFSLENCASRHSGVQFFNISTSKSGPNMQCFVHFHLKMCFSPQRRAIFQHPNVKKCSEPLSFLACSKMCFSLQRRAIFDFSSDHMTPHPPL